MTEEKAKKEIEELEKEATEYATEYANRFWRKKESLDRACTIDNFKDGYLAGAEPREKRIEELEEENEKLKEQIEQMRCCENCKYNSYWGNEWHFVKDKDYPKDNKPVLCILGDIDSDNCEVGYYNDVKSGEPWHFETYHLPDDDGVNAWGVSAWKEIVLPEPTKYWDLSTGENNINKESE